MKITDPEVVYSGRPVLSGLFQDTGRGPLGDLFTWRGGIEKFSFQI